MMLQYHYIKRLEDVPANNLETDTKSELLVLKDENPLLTCTHDTRTTHTHTLSLYLYIITDMLHGEGLFTLCRIPFSRYRTDWREIIQNEQSLLEGKRADGVSSWS